MAKNKPTYQKHSFDLPHPLEPEKNPQPKRKSLMEKPTINDYLMQWAVPMLLMLGVSLAVFLGYAALSFEGQLDHMIQIALGTTPESVSNATGPSVELLAAILGIVITVVAIVLQLAAQRYGTRLIDLFLEDKVNRAYFFLMVITLLYAILIVFGLKDEFYPAKAVTLLLWMTLVEIALLAPYFLYVFKFLTPTNLLSSIQETNQINVQRAVQVETPQNVSKLQKEVAIALEQVTDTALSANSQMDRNLGLMAINQIREMVLDYLECKHEQSEDWFKVNQDHFIGISSEFYQEICDKKLWFEAKALMDMELIYKSCLQSMPDAVSAIAFNTRIIGMEAIKNKDYDLLDLVVQFFNTFIRISLNAKNVRAIFNLFYQYRILNEHIFDYKPELSSKVVFYFKYYGETCLQQGMWFVMYTAAFDIAHMLSCAYKKGVSNIEDLLRTFLSLEDNLDKTKDQLAFIGVRKAQIILATYLFGLGERKLVKVMVDDLKGGKKEELTQYRDQLLSVTSRKFWEVTDRGVNLEYIDEEQKEYLKAFYDEMILTDGEEEA